MHGMCGNPDSALFTSRTLRTDLSGSYITERTWWAEQQQAFFIKGLGETRYRKTFISGWRKDHFIHTQVGYTMLPDSGWVKNADAFKVHLRWIETGKKRLSHTYSVNMQTQWLNTWLLGPNGKKWVGGFMNPALLEVGYSFTWDFLKGSNLMLTPATLQVAIQPRDILSSGAAEKPAMSSRHSNVYSRYGFSAYVTIDESFYKDLLLLQHRSRVFFNAIAASQVQFDISNRLCIRFWKFLQVRLDTTLYYLPEQSLRLQYRQEVLLGIFYEYRK